MSWPVISFGEIANFRNGLNYSRKNFGSGLKIISVANFGSRLVPDLASLDEINPEGVAKAEDYLCDGDILFVRSNGNRDLVGRAMLMKGIADLAVGFSGFCIRARFTVCNINPAFYAYLFRAPIVRHQMTAGGVGANIANVSQKTLARLEVPFPPKDEQDAIVVVLSMYDELIATNQRRILLLEEAARSLYRQWFVCLRFPGHESMSIKDGVPKGWVKAPIIEHVSFLNRGITPKYDDTASGIVINQKCIRDGRISMAPARRQSKNVKPERLIQVGDILINSTGAGTLGRVAQVRTPIKNCTVDTHVTIVRPLDEDSSSYLGQALLELAPVLSTMGKGSTNQLELSRVDIGAIEIWQPPKYLLSEFHRLVIPMLEQIANLSFANLSLAKHRDLLLPRLMSGQLDVSGISLPD
ncbi:restriction endonuclease subunit S [Aeromonas veronii]